MKAIVEFIAMLENYKANFVISEYDYKAYECEIATMFDLHFQAKEKFVSFVSSLFAKALQEQNLTLKHPFHNEISCALTYSFAPNDICWGADTPAFVNFCFFTDKNNEFPFLLLQVHHFFNFLVVENKIIAFPGSMHLLNRLSDAFPHLSKLDLSKLCFQKKKFAFILTQWRPYHYLNEILYGLCEIHRKAKMQIPVFQKGFFYPDFCYTDNEASVFIRPCICPGNFMPELDLNIIKFICQESLTKFNALVSKQDCYDAFDKWNLSSQEIENLITQKEKIYV